MATLEVRSVPNLLGTPVSYAYAIKAPWIFLTGHEALISRGVSRRSCRPVGLSPVRAAPQPARGRFYLATHAAHPKEFGSDLGNGVRLDQYYPTPAAVDPYHLARHAEFGDYIPPTTSVVMERCFAADNNISTLPIAAMLGHEIHKIHPPGIRSAPSSGFVPAVVCDDFVFLAGQMAHNAGQGLDPWVHVPDHSTWAGSGIRKQTEFIILEKLEPALEAAGSSLERSLKAQIYLAQVDDFPNFIDAWSRYYANYPVRGGAGADQILGDGGRDYRDQSVGVDQHRDPPEADDSRRHPR